MNAAKEQTYAFKSKQEFHWKQITEITVWEFEKLTTNEKWKWIS